ncbi:hypothetical protein [Geodermatophilus sp. CPCC 205506]|uniref:hypothetical protein n=1 Tax=Geodermatophilus sp. CPCC 205506 TaxID=2936596 RepID=UPI003EEF8205
METKRCANCKRSKPVGDFYWNKTKQQWYGRCKPCHRERANELRRERRARMTPEERAAQNAKQYANATQRREEMGDEAWRAYRLALFDAYVAESRQKLWQYLREHPCMDCGETDIVVLHFDHRDRESKEMIISRMVASGRRWAVMLREIEKCDVVCGNCHARRTATQMGWGKAPVSGTAADAG